MPLSVRLLFTVLILAVATADHARAADAQVHYNHIHFQVERSRPVENDRMQATLSVTAEDDAAAITAARAILKANDLEIWERERFVARLKPGDRPRRPSAPE